MFKFQSAGDCQQRLAGCVILLNQRPFYIIEAKTHKDVEGYDILLRDKKVVVDLTANCVSSPRVGYCNYENRAVYITRKPIRRIRQGVCRENLASSRGTVSSDNLVSKDFGRMFLNQYPSLEEVYDTVVKKQERYSMAFSRDFSIDNDGEVYYQGHHVGRIDEKLTVTFAGKFSCLKELYERESKRPSS